MLNVDHIFSSVNFLLLFFIAEQFYCASNAPAHDSYAGALGRQFTYMHSYKKPEKKPMLHPRTKCVDTRVLFYVHCSSASSLTGAGIQVTCAKNNAR